MRLSRGRGVDPEPDQRRTREMVDRVAETDEPGVRVWTPRRQVVFGRRDRRSDGYERARETARVRGYAVRERAAGGRAVAYTGQTIAFALAEPVDDYRTGIQTRYDRALDSIGRALAVCGVDAERGEPPDSFCPGSHSLQVDAGKVAGVAQRVTQDVAVVTGVIVVRDHDAIADVLGPVYADLGVEFDPSSVGSLAASGGTADAATVVEALETTFDADYETTSTSVRET